jgi:predicted ATPase/DNA-binding CsgD family transcriptional regulator
LATKATAVDGTRLSRREREVAALVADGLTNRQIATKLFISERTADSHLEQIRQKLGVSTRSQIATWFVTRSREPQTAEPPGGNHWPPQPTVLLGRDRELTEVREFLLRPEVRLLTVTGPPGTGKTRLSSWVALDLMAEFKDGARFVDLSAISDQTLVLSAIGQAIGARPTLDGLVAALRPKRCILLLDNFEQVVGAASQIAELLACCPDIKVLVTSRECLHLLRWEHEFALQPLELPDLNHLPPVSVLSTVPAIALFIERARARSSSFVINDETGPIVARICVRLDGLPLAIELAAATVKVLPPAAILAHLKGQDLAIQGGADFPKRHQTLTRAIGTSHDLLSHAEKTLFRRLGAFVGGFTLESMTEVCAGDGFAGGDRTALLSQLIDKSLVQIDGGGGRYRLLETIREFALDKLVTSGELEAVIARRAHYFVGLAERAEQAYEGPEVAELFELLRLEIDNFRAVINGAIDDRDLETGLRLGIALSYFWYMNGFLDEGQARLATLVALAEETGEIQRFPKALRELGILTGTQFDYAAARVHLLSYLDKARSAGDKAGSALALTYLGGGAIQDDLEAAQRYLEESLELRRECGDVARVPYSLAWLAMVAHLQHDEAAANSLLAQSLVSARSQNGQLAEALGLVMRGRFAFDRGNYDEAASDWTQCLKLATSFGGVWHIPSLLEYFAKLAILRGRPLIALRLAGASDAMRAVIGAPYDPLWYGDFDQRIDVAAGGDARHHPEWFAGRLLPTEEALRLAYSVWDGAPSPG